MSEFLVNLLSTMGSKLLQGILAWWKQKELEAKAAQAAGLEELVRALKEEEQRAAILREEAKKTVDFSYDAWKAQP